MTDQPPPGDWIADWTRTQQEAWQRLLQGLPASPASPQPPPDASGWSRELLEFGDRYLGISRQFWSLLQPGAAASRPAASPESLEALTRTFTDSLGRLYGQAGPGGDALAAWSGLSGTGGVMPGWPGVPALGPTRQRQEQQSRLMAAAARFQRAVARHGEILSRVAAAAVERMAATLSGGAAPGSLREMHELWVAKGEEAWAAAAHGAEFAAAQAELHAALLELRAEQQRTVEDWARTLDLPTRSEVNTLNERVMDLRRRLREVEEELDRLRGRAAP